MLEKNEKNFQRWFGQSQVVNPDGFPKLVYHGTRAKFTVFDKDAIAHFGFHVGTLAQASQFSKKPMALFAAISNAIRLPDLGMWGFENVARNVDSRGLGIINHAEYERAWNANDQSGELRKILQSKGFDGVVYKNEVEGKGESYIAFEPAQLKRATHNCGAYDPGDPDIRDQKARALQAKKFLSSVVQPKKSAVPHV